MLELVAAKRLLATQTTRGGSHVAATSSCPGSGTQLHGCGSAADLVPQRPSSPAARAHRPRCPATIATPPPLPCRPQLRAAPLVRIARGSWLPPTTRHPQPNEAPQVVRPATNVSAPGTQAVCITTRHRRAVWAPRPAHFPAGPGPQAGRVPAYRGHTTAQCRRVQAAYAPRPARALLSALHRAAESAGSRSRPRPAPPPQGLRHWPTKCLARIRLFGSRGNSSEIRLGKQPDTSGRRPRTRGPRGSD